MPVSEQNPHPSPIHGGSATSALLPDTARSLSDLPDLLLVERARRRDARAFEALMRRYNRRLFRIARSVLRDDDLAEDAMQEAYINAFTHLDSYEPRGRFGAWLARIALNEALMLRRRLMADQTVSLEHLDESTHADTSAGGFSASASLDAVSLDPVEAMHARQLLESAIDALPEGFRMVFVLRMVEQLNVSETAACLGLNEATVRTRLFRAQRRLRMDLTRRLRQERLNIFEFAGERCDRIVARVLARLRHLMPLEKAP